VTPRGFAGPSLLAMILFEKFGQHQPLNRQSERYAREGVDLSLSTLADLVGACTTVLQPLHALIEAHVLGAERLHGDDTNVPILAKSKTIKGHIWTYVRDDRQRGDRRRSRTLGWIKCGDGIAANRRGAHQVGRVFAGRQKNEVTCQRAAAAARADTPGWDSNRSIIRNHQFWSTLVYQVA
jgi:hypothetical protein